jgi:RNA polymerase sigma-70 factor (ECF subfamily)
MVEENHLPNFDQLILPHLDAAHNLARWLIRNPADAEDAIQEAFLRALRFFDGFRGGDSRAWLLKIVRNTCYSWIRKNRPTERFGEFDEIVHSSQDMGEDAEAKLVSRSESERLTKAIETLPAVFREVLVLREFEGLSYKEISDVTGIQMGTVMSTLSRARQRLREELRPAPEREPSRGSHLRLKFLAQGAASDQSLCPENG